MEEFTEKIVLAVGAHPDDIDFGCGATMAMLSKKGAKLVFAVCTQGDRGSRHHQVEKEGLIKSRKKEQLAAAQILGSSDVHFLEEEDGNLVADITFKEKVVRLIRQVKPDMIFTHDPAWFYTIREDGSSMVNHTDHRACGEAVLDAVYPLSRDLQSFPHHMAEGLEPHIVPELYLFNFDKPNFVFDVTGFLEKKFEAIAAHKSQIDDLEGVKKRLSDRAKLLGKKYDMDLAEGFIKLKFA